MGRAYLGPEAQPRWQQARIDVIRRIGDVAREHGAEFVVAAGDVFDDNVVDPHTVARTCDALATIEVPVYLLPGNHDPLDGNTIYRSPRWRDARPGHVHVIESTAPIDVPGTDAQIVGAPWASRRPGRDLNNEALAAAGDCPAGTVRILLGHGQVDAIAPDTSDPSLVALQPLLDAAAAGRLHYAALGDRHSTLDVEGHGLVWFSGSPEVTAFRDTDAGNVLAVELTPDKPPAVSRHRVGEWVFERHEIELSDDASVAALEALLAAYPSPTTTVVRLVVNGVLSLSANRAFETLLAARGPALARLDFPPRHDHRLLKPDAAELLDLDLRGYARAALEELLAAAEDDRVAAEALTQFYRIEMEARR